MLISVVTPVLNGEKTIERTLRSLASQRADYEHIVMDGGSRDSTAAIVRRYESVYPVKWFSKPDRSVFEGLWNGLERINGDIIGNIFADDFYLPCTLATVKTVFEQHPEIDWITGIPSWHFEDTGVSATMPYAPVYIQKWIRAGYYAPTRLNPLQHESIFWRRSLWEKEKGNVRELMLKYRFAAEFHMWRRFATHTPLRTVCSNFACFSISAEQVSVKNRQKYLEECGLGGKKPWNQSFSNRLVRAVSLLLSKRVVELWGPKAP
jgi:glycosyltransferase involved in cell wall biosynthesis